jgi:hypothetical protein
MVLDLDHIPACGDCDVIDAQQPLDLVRRPRWSDGQAKAKASALSLACSLQGGDPAKLAAALFKTKAQTLLDQADAHRELSSDLAHVDA